MQGYAAILRGIAPSGKNMTNDKLRGVFERLGFERVQSVVSSGNIVFRAPEQEIAELEQRIEGALTADLGLSSRVIIRTLPGLRALLDSDPFPGLTHGRGSYLTATFLNQGAAEPEQLPTQDDPRARIVGYDRPARAILSVIDNSEPGQTSDFMAQLEKEYGKQITTRTWLTVQRIVKKLET